VIEEIRALLQQHRLPPVLNDARCQNCSLQDTCLPGVVGNPARLRGMQSALFQPWGTLEPNE
jgi:CRISPR-associated exonuclease Cas4